MTRYGFMEARTAPMFGSQQRPVEPVPSLPDTSSAAPSTAECERFAIVAQAEASPQRTFAPPSEGIDMRLRRRTSMPQQLRIHNAGRHDWPSEPVRATRLHDPAPARRAAAQADSRLWRWCAVVKSRDPLATYRDDRRL